jgi:serine phosphatase RsbU (regulator of sigma subunit)
MAEIIRKNHYESPHTISDMIMEDVKRHSKGSNIIDDRTLIVVKRDPEETGAQE